MNSPTYRFTPVMFRAVTVDRTKTKTRRVITPEPPDHWTPGPCGFYNPTVQDHEGNQFGGPSVFGAADAYFGVAAPYGPPGTIKPVVTTWAVAKAFDCYAPRVITESMLKCAVYSVIWWDDGSPKPDWAGKSRPAMFFPKHLYNLAPQSRCVAVKAERVQDISEEDAIAEGMVSRPSQRWEGKMVYRDYSAVEEGDEIEWFQRSRDSFRTLWDSINAERGKGDRKGCYAWAANPWVFATTFELV